MRGPPSRALLYLDIILVFGGGQHQIISLHSCHQMAPLKLTVPIEKGGVLPYSRCRCRWCWAPWGRAPIVRGWRSASGRGWSAQPNLQKMTVNLRHCLPID